MANRLESLDCPLRGHYILIPYEAPTDSEGYNQRRWRSRALWSDSEFPGLYSRAPTYFCGRTLTPRAGTAGPQDRRDGTGVHAEQEPDRTLQQDQAVHVSMSGTISARGKATTSQLPAVPSDSAVTFDTGTVTLGPIVVKAETLNSE